MSLACPAGLETVLLLEGRYTSRRSDNLGVCTGSVDKQNIALRKTSISKTFLDSIACGYRIKAITPAFQAGDGGSIPPTRFHFLP